MMLNAKMKIKKIPKPTEPGAYVRGRLEAWRAHLGIIFDRKPHDILADILMVSLERIIHDNGHRNIEKLEEGLRQMNFRDNVPTAAKCVCSYFEFA